MSSGPSLARAILLGATAVVLSVALLAMVTQAIPWWVLALLLVGYASFATLGVIIQRLKMFGNPVLAGSPGRGRIALTFDDGPHPETTRRVLDLLRAHGQRATFFVIGKKVDAHPEVLREIVEQGHEVGLHSYGHEWLYCFKTPAQVQQDIVRSQRAVERACGVKPILFRAPVGMISSRTSAGVKAAGAVLIGWSARGVDCLPHRLPQAVRARVTRGLVDGAIVLLHDSAERDDFTPPSLEILGELLGEVTARGLTSVTVSELLDSSTGEQLVAGGSGSQRAAAVA